MAESQAGKLTRDVLVGRARARGNRDLPRNLYMETKGGRTYFTYRFPDGRRESMSQNKAQAIAAANVLNMRFASAEHLVARALERHALPAGANPTIPTLVEEFRRQYLQGKRYTERSRSEIEYKLAQYVREWPKRTVRSIETIDLSRFLNEQTVHTYVKHRKLLLDLMQFACHQGYRKDNPAAVTLVKTAAETDKVRRRHTLEGYRLVHAAAPEWLQRAMDILLYSLQRREDVVLLHRDQVNLSERTITMLQRKTRNYKNPVYLEIEMGEPLYKAVRAAVRPPLHCPYLVHCRPKRMSKKIRDAKPHHFAVLPAYLTRMFAHYRDAAGAYAEMAPAERPTIHELRALGIHLYREAGYPNSYIMALSGHADERMLEHYDADHAVVKPRRVSAGLDLKTTPDA